MFASQAASGDRRSSGHKTPSMTLDTNGPPYLKFLARPEAATKVEDSAAARNQLLAFSGQLLNQDGEHAFDLYGLL